MEDTSAKESSGDLDWRVRSEHGWVILETVRGR